MELIEINNFFQLNSSDSYRIMSPIKSEVLLSFDDYEYSKLQPGTASLIPAFISSVFIKSKNISDVLLVTAK